MSEFHHVSVLLDECIEGLNIKPDGIYVDGTLGGAGHSYHIAEKLTTGRLIGIDRDPVALKAAGERRLLLRTGDAGPFQFLPHGPGFAGAGHFRRGWNSAGPGRILSPAGRREQRLLLYDGRSPGYAHGQWGALSADTVVNTWSYEELKCILYDYGEERYAPAIAAAIVRKREISPIRTTLELVDVIRSAMPPAALRRSSILPSGPSRPSALR